MKYVLPLMLVSLAAPVAAQQDLSKVEIKAQQLAPGVAVLFGAGGNIGVSCGEDGTVLIDDQFAPLTAKIQKSVADLGATPVKFLIACVGDKSAALHLVDEVRGCFTKPLILQNTELVVGASIGIAHATADDDAAVTAEALMRDADTAMYRSKAEGPGRSTIFDTSMHDRVRERIGLETALRTVARMDGIEPTSNGAARARRCCGARAASGRIAWRRASLPSGC